MRELPQALACACLLGVLTSACGGQGSSPAPSSKSSPSTNSTQSPSNAGGTSSGPRLAWDQYAPSADELKQYSFVLYVDGTAVLLPNATCGALSGDPSTAPCSSPLPAMTPGQHTLEMATRMTVDGSVVESARSAPIVYTVGTPGFSSETEGARETGPAPESPGSEGEAESPHLIETVVQGLDRPCALAFLPDGRLLTAERGGRIRLAEGGVLAVEPAAVLPGADPGEDARISLAVAPDFQSSRQVFISYASVDADGVRTGLVVRFREVGGALGEPALIIGGLPADVSAPRVRFGPDGALYVGTTALDPQGADDLGSYAGKILRFAPDGTTPADNPIRSSPVFSVGHRGQIDFDWDPATGRLWYAETDAAGLVLGRTVAGRQGEPVARLEGVQAAAIAFHAGASPESWRGSLLVASPDQACLYRVSGLSSSPAEPGVEQLLLGQFGRIDVVLSAEGGFHFATANGPAGGKARSSDAAYRVRDAASGR